MDKFLGYRCISIGTVMRNTASIYEYKQALDCDNIMDAKTSTVKGKQVIFIQEYK